ncbi:hypothetical protein halTADL_3119 [Halohasta litchfieldiae]|uniref:TFIIB-type zinc ribbon-containing protein n=1 Tax=Halohasta litchfieldiae TaxID=1073996 RepID=A0A1H6R8P7_9EURY|nr:hypothetical protein [Halohasta litchfieldiae]ATW89821.1 hypothetical protein halTADL_3119 [Halohasta litchfieldiae]SEI52201.1 hypothetical protein SAMN05444271_1025 [Halohasta litchfieldiae]
MKIRGTRECQSCDAQWSYYETGSVRCPNCGSMRSVGVDEDRREHTDSPAELDLEPVRRTLATEPLEHAVDDLKQRLREYTRKRGFIKGGELQPLDDRYLAARELLHAADLAARSHSPTETEELYVLELLGGTDRGEWPPETEIPDSLAAARGLAVAEAVEAYRRDLRTWLEDHPDPEATKTLGSLREQIKRAEALQGEVSLGTTNSLVAAARAIGQYLRTGDENALASARDRLQRLQ